VSSSEAVFRRIQSLARSAAVRKVTVQAPERRQKAPVDRAANAVCTITRTP